ncbi:hypothetical protein COTS27_00575 [Spirochaetota bacterium]|nr:hypothetical protein COTS27_00575 [Spirochaetota bacterium]
MVLGAECSRKTAVPLLMRGGEREETGSLRLMNKCIKCVTFKDYKQLFVKRNKIYAGYCVFYYKKHSVRRVIKASASRKVGKAHDRNYYKRRIRSILQSLPLKDNILILAIILKPHQMTFDDEKKYLAKKLKTLLY